MRGADRQVDGPPWVVHIAGAGPAFSSVGISAAHIGSQGRRGHRWRLSHRSAKVCTFHPSCLTLSPCLTCEGDRPLESTGLCISSMSQKEGGGMGPSKRHRGDTESGLHHKLCRTAAKGGKHAVVCPSLAHTFLARSRCAQFTVFIRLPP